MSKKSGQLLWNRQHVNLPAGPFTLDTGLTQLNRAWANSSADEPGFDGPSRIQVIPMAPLAAWADVTHGEPTFNPATQTVRVTFFNASEGPTTLNVLFWDPATVVGPGEADLYAPIS